MRRSGLLLVLLVAAVVLYGLQKTTPGYSAITSPILSEGHEGERVAASAFAARLDGLHPARSLAVESFGRTKTLSTSGVWIVAEVQAEAIRESLALNFANWEAKDGTRYALSQRPPPVPGYLTGETFEPGLPRTVLMAFEVPEEAIAGGRLILARTALYPLDDEVSIRTKDEGRSPAPMLTIRAGEEGQGWQLDPQ